MKESVVLENVENRIKLIKSSIEIEKEDQEIEFRRGQIKIKKSDASISKIKYLELEYSEIEQIANWINLNIKGNKIKFLKSTENKSIEIKSNWP